MIFKYRLFDKYLRFIENFTNRLFDKYFIENIKIDSQQKVNMHNS